MMRHLSSLINVSISQHVCASASTNVLFNCLQKRFVHHHRDWEGPGGLERFLGWRRGKTFPAKAQRHTQINEKRFRRLRGQKTVIIELEDDVERRELEQFTPDQMRMYFLRKGRQHVYKDIAPRDWSEHQITFNSFGQIIEPSVPPEVFHFQPSEIFADAKNYLVRKYHGFTYGIRRIKKKEGFEKFNIKEFPKVAENIYIDAYESLARRERKKLHNLITETAFAKLWPEVEKATLQWKLVRFIEPSRVVNVRCYDNPQKSGNDIAQITVRMHSTQIMALYDKDGHLLVGHPEETSDSLEYVVFENHIASLDGKWRFHDRIFPDWLRARQPILRKGLIEGKDEEEGAPVKLQGGMQTLIAEMAKKRDEKEKKGMLPKDE